MEREGDYSIHTVQSAREALEELSRNAYDVVVSDLYMPVMDGLDLLREIRSQGNAIPFIICTGVTEDGKKQQSFSLGADSFIVKEGDPVKFFDLLCRAVNEAVRKC